MANTTGKKFGGRKIESKNKTPFQTKVMLKEFVDKQLDNFEETIDKLEPKEQAELVVKMLPYVVPRQSEVSITENEPPKKIVIKYPRRNE
jgi:hypothetical protein